LNRRDFLAAFAVTSPLAASDAQPGDRGIVPGPSAADPASPAVAAPANGSAERSAMGINLYSFAYRRPKSAYEFLEYCHSLGAGGVQTELDSLDPGYLKRLRQRAEELDMYLEIICGLPSQDTAKFEQSVSAAKEAGARCLRSACLSGRRYETFSTFDAWKKFVADSKASLARAVPVLERNGMLMGLENHKDWTADELAVLLKEYSSEYLGACLDTGNNIALLDDPYELAERLAPYAVSTHFKDMALDEYKDGILLSEVPLGEGIWDMKRLVGIISRARPKTRFTLEMITRDPLKVPCLTQNYWATFPDRSGAYLARTLSMVRAHRPQKPLPRPESLDREARLSVEEENVKICLAYARQKLGLQQTS
jgi:3-oxoisoapionate decarboxylase